MKSIMHTGTRAAGLVVAAVVMSACQADRVVYREKEPVVVSAAASKYMGYSDTTTKQTVCGTCHKDEQANWMTTKHAVAWTDLKASDHATSACEDCHSAGKLGNDGAVAGGWATTKDLRYVDVQCESCHGAGLDHATSPTLSNIPLATMAASGDPAKNKGCTGCHNGVHHPYAEEWAQSPHAVMEYTTDPAEDPAHIVQRDATTGAVTECMGCHTGEYALRKSPTSTAAADVIGFKAGVTRGYKEATNDPTVANFQRLTCTVCHDPHRNTPAQLRFPVATADTTQNLCIRCHNRRATNPSSWRGPHSGEGQLVMGLNSGWRPPGFMDPLPARIAGTHADPTANPKQCATCHMARYDIVDKAGTYVSSTTGHTFNGFPCLNAKGQPTGDVECALTQRSFKGCLGGGCHSSEDAARNVFTTVDNRLEYLMEELKGLLENTAKVPCTEYVYSGKPVTVARGARFNYLLAAGHGTQAADVCSSLSNGEFIRSLPTPEPSHGAVAHNPAYLEQLLTGSIRAVKAKYYQ